MSIRLNVNCTRNEDCPNHTYCGSGYYNDDRTHDCINIGCSGHCIGQFYCKKDKSVYFFNKNEEEGIRFYSLPFENAFGIREYGKCRYDNECLGDLHCRYKNFFFFGIGHCEQPTDSTDISGLYFGFFFLALIFIFVIICSSICVVVCIRYLRNDKNEENKGLTKKKHNPLKILIITGAIVGFTLLFFIIIAFINEHLNKKPL